MQMCICVGACVYCVCMYYANVDMCARLCVLCVYILCKCAYVWVLVCVRVCIMHTCICVGALLRPKLGHTLDGFSTLLNKTGPFNQTQKSLFWLVLLASLLRESLTLPSQVGITGRNYH